VGEDSRRRGGAHHGSPEEASGDPPERAGPRRRSGPARLSNQSGGSGAGLEATGAKRPGGWRGVGRNAPVCARTRGGPGVWVGQLERGGRQERVADRRDGSAGRGGRGGGLDCSILEHPPRGGWFTDHPYPLGVVLSPWTGRPYGPGLESKRWAGCGSARGRLGAGRQAAAEVPPGGPPAPRGGVYSVLPQQFTATGPLGLRLVHPVWSVARCPTRFGVVLRNGQHRRVREVVWATRRGPAPERCLASLTTEL